MEILAFSVLGLLDDILHIAYAAMGLGLVIFIHELGHFLVAKWCDVRVERFSIGFGPILLKRTWGETEYALSSIPLGGYVKMLGQDDADPSKMADERIARDPRSYTAKSVPQRMAIISAGVINNMVSAVLFFVLAFMFGVKYAPAVVGQVTPGKPAWAAGLRLGDKITRVNDRVGDQLGFIDIRQAVALSGEGDVRIEGLRDGKHFSTRVHPELGGLFPQIYVEPESGLTLPDADDDPQGHGPALAGLSAASAQPPFQYGDEIVEIDGVAVAGYADLQRTLAGKRDREVTIGVHRHGDAPNAALTAIHVEPNRFRTLGLTMAIGKIKAIQQGSPAEGKLRSHDTMTDVKDEKGDWLPIGVGIDPLRLPDWFAERAGQKVQVRVKRDVKEGNPVSEEVELVPDERPGWIERPAAGDCPLSVPAIGVAFHVLHHVVAVDENGPAAKAGIRKDDNLVSIRFIPEEGAPKTEGAETVTFEDKSRNWAHAFWLLQSYPLRKVMVEFKALGDDKPRTVEVVPDVAADWYLPMRGFTMKQLLKTRRADNIGEAISMGFGTARDELVNMWMTIRGLTSRRISTKALGGPIRIFGTALHFTRLGLPDLMLFLGILSVSLAVLNFLPIPVLDGGHFMFLCWEGIRGKPPSDWVVVTATYIGFALVLTLMAWVMYMDIAGIMSRAG